jgi:penicillin-binding protein 1B
VLAALLVVAAGGGWLWIGWQFPLPGPESGSGPTLRLTAGAVEFAVLPGTSGRSQHWVPLDRIPRHLVDAVLVAEDRGFFRHPGIDWKAVLRAAVMNLRRGGVHQGGSTVTQQLARLLFLDGQRTWARKVREAVIALLLELRYTKAQILEAYLNCVYLGQDGPVSVIGFGAAARQYLDLDLSQVRLEDAALLAAAIRAPNRIFAGAPRTARASRNTLLAAMAEAGVAGEAAVRQAQARPVRWQPTRRAAAPYFVDLAREEIRRRLTLPQAGEVRIATTLDPSLQRSAEQAIQRTLDRLERRPGHGRGSLQAALVAMEPATGSIRALVGGRGYAESPFNRAVRASRQPGSLFKPFVYLAAFEAGGSGDRQALTPASLVADAPLALRAGDARWAPRNLDRRFHGPVTVRRALEDSLNLPAVRVAQEVGLPRVTEVARAMGITSHLAPVPSLALGTSEVTLLEITTAFAGLANLGVPTLPTTLEADPPPAAFQWSGPRLAPHPAVSAEAAFLVTNLLRGVMREGTGRSSARYGLSEITAGKTGSSDGLRDAWFVGYTPDLVVGVWVGRDDGTSIGMTGAEAALPIWAEVMQGAVQRVPPRPFTPPPGVVFVEVNRDTGQPVAFGCGEGPALAEAFRAGTEPVADCGLPLARPLAGVLDWIRNLFR